MPWNHAGVTESPFVTVFRSVNVPGAAHIMNFVVLTAALSGANAALYISSRMLFSLARTGWAPSVLGRLNSKGSPTFALLVSSYGIVVALALEHWAASNAFVYILRGAFFGMMLSWIVSLAAHISFRRGVTPEQAAAIPAPSPLKGWGSVIGLTVVLGAIGKTWYDSRINLVSGVAFLVGLTVLYFLLKPSAKSATRP
jgi:AAT family amino acid transporter